MRSSGLTFLFFQSSTPGCVIPGMLLSPPMWVLFVVVVVCF